MILAAGHGTRLHPLTLDTPKALLPIGDVPVLEHVARRLIDAGVRHLIINAHHHADKIRAFVASRDSFGIDVDISIEQPRALETGGGLKNAEKLFGKEEPFFLHNADILTEVDLRRLYTAHVASGVLATLAVRPLESARYLIFDDAGLCGFSSAGKHDTDGRDRFVRETSGTIRRFDFSGIHIISPSFFDVMTEEGAFSIINTYLRLARQGERILPFETRARWIDIGTHEQLEEARRWFA